MMFIFVGDKGIQQITERIYFFHIREFFAFQMRAEECFQGFQQCRSCVAWQYFIIQFVWNILMKRGLAGSYRADVYRSCRRFLVIIHLNCFFLLLTQIRTLYNMLIFTTHLFLSVGFKCSLSIWHRARWRHEKCLKGQKIKMWKDWMSDLWAYIAFFNHCLE